MLRLRFIAMMLATPLLFGCSDGLQQKTYPVSGEVRWNGKPVKGITVVLRPTDKSKFKWQEIPQAITDESGKFAIHTYTSNDGAPAGEYLVGIALMDAVSEEGDDQVKRDLNAPKFPTKYADPEKSGLRATVNTKATVLEPFELVD
ncbi:MAG: hypothetical protein KGQ51_09645 [Planctomycetes bacterium]|nr:hypothetical protein [Planctomycetota bacterium]